MHTSAENLTSPSYATDPAGKPPGPDPEFYPESSGGYGRITASRKIWYLYRYDKYGRPTEKTDRIPKG
ncbi:hypothetical protein KCP76_20345 [Salmonella enterica subsp. enterica serovar Weltevreden]|nr:hypothetical protein KCP76_20345 [Salmonella enterica subsp. enterica serovar Weltevreden]